MAENNDKVHSKVMEYVFMGIAIGIGSLLVWDITSTNDNTKAINGLIKDVSNNRKDHIAEVDRSKDVDAKQERDVVKNEAKLDQQLERIHNNENKLGILFDRSK